MKKILDEEFEIKTFKVGPLNTNCYIVLNKEKNVAAVVDPGFYDNNILSYVKKNNIVVELILLTHGHFDHFIGANFLNAKTTYIHELDKEMLEDCEKNAGILAGITDFEKIYNLKTFKDSEKIKFADEEFLVVHTPGHSKGSCCFIFKNNVIFTGDTIFKQSLGRTDLFGGDYNILINSVKKIFKFNKNFIILPGHGESSTLNNEKSFNNIF